MRRRRSRRLPMRRATKPILAAAALLASSAGPLAAQDGAAADPRPEVALMGTIPIYWGEADGISDILSGAAPAHWARGAIERHYRITPRDYLSAEALAGQHLLLLAQPRGLTAEENVALDAFVRGGGRVVLFADPLMTGVSRFAIGDRRRPQDVALLSPILGHWGLELRFDEAQPEGLAHRGEGELAVPVNLAGELVVRDGAGPCRVALEGLVAECQLGAGAALVVADAALLDGAGPWPGAQEALDLLLRSGFAQSGESLHAFTLVTANPLENQDLPRAAEVPLMAMPGDDPPP